MLVHICHSIKNISFEGCYSQNDIQIIPVVLGSANHTIRDAHRATTQKGVSLVSSLPAGTQEIKSLILPKILVLNHTESDKFKILTLVGFGYRGIWLDSVRRNEDWVRLGGMWEWCSIRTAVHTTHMCFYGPKNLPKPYFRVFYGFKLICKGNSIFFLQIKWWTSIGAI